METLWKHPEETQHFELVRHHSWFKFDPNQPTVNTIGNVLPVHIPSDSKHCGKTCGNLVENLPITAQRDVLQEIGGIGGSFSFGRQCPSLHIEDVKDYIKPDSWPRTVPPFRPVVADKQPLRRFTPFPPRQLDWVAPSFCIADRASDFDIPIPSVKPISDRYLSPVTSEQELAASAAWVGGRELSFDKCLRLSLPLSKKPVAPTFTDFRKRPATQVCGWPIELGGPWVVLPHPSPTQLQRLPDTQDAKLGLQGQTVKKRIEGFPKFEDVHMSHGITRTPTPRKVGAYFCPDCFVPVVVGYRTVQAGEPLWNVPLWNLPLHKVPMLTLLLWGNQGIVFPRRFQITGQRTSHVAMDDDSFTSGCNLGWYEVPEPVIRATKGMFHEANEHVVSYFALRKKYVAPIGYGVHRIIKTRAV